MIEIILYHLYSTNENAEQKFSHINRCDIIS